MLSEGGENLYLIFTLFALGGFFFSGGRMKRNSNLWFSSSSSHSFLENAI